jgi:hypothetical protein
MPETKTVSLIPTSCFVKKIGKPDLIGIATLETFLQESQLFIGEP